MSLRSDFIKLQNLHALIQKWFTCQNLKLSRVWKSTQKCSTFLVTCIIVMTTFFFPSRPILCFKKGTKSPILSLYLSEYYQSVYHIRISSPILSLSESSPILSESRHPIFPNRPILSVDRSKTPPPYWVFQIFVISHYVNKSSCSDLSNKSFRSL